MNNATEMTISRLSWIPNMTRRLSGAERGGPPIRGPASRRAVGLGLLGRSLLGGRLLGRSLLGSRSLLGGGLLGRSLLGRLGRLLDGGVDLLGSLAGRGRRLRRHLGDLRL